MFLRTQNMLCLFFFFFLLVLGGTTNLSHYAISRPEPAEDRNCYFAPPYATCPVVGRRGSGGISTMVSHHHTNGHLWFPGLGLWEKKSNSSLTCLAAGEGRTHPSTTRESTRSPPDARKPIWQSNTGRGNGGEGERGRKVHGLVREADLKR